MTTFNILAAAGQTIVLAALCFVVTCAVLSHLRFQALARSVKPGSGLAGESAFQLCIAQKLGTAHREPQPFTVLLVKPLPCGQPETPELVTQVQERLRALVRRNDVVMRYRDDVVALLFPAGRQAADVIGRRILGEALRLPYRTAAGADVPLQLRAGAVAYPEDGSRAGELRAKAEEALPLAEAQAGTFALAWPLGATAPSLPAHVTHAGVPDEDTPDQKKLLDELTGVLQEARLGQALQKYVAQYRRDDQPVAVLCLDVDYLRRYNDQYGRKTGDRMLRHVADFIQHATREEDLIARHDGDQFVVAFPATATQALAVAQRLLAGLRRTSFEGSGPGLRLTATIGVAAFPEHGLVGRELFEAAQAALRMAKGKGRNQCLLFQESMRKFAPAHDASDAF